MKFVKRIMLFISIGFCLACESNPVRFELRDNLSEAEFRDALIGTWFSVWERPDVWNVTDLNILRNGIAFITMQKDGEEKKSVGRYQILFLQPPQKDKTTYADFILKTERGNIRLHKLYSGLHNGVLIDDEPFLRIEREPYGVLKKRYSFGYILF